MINVLAITMYSGESELSECKESIFLQKNSKINHVIISGLTEINAHNELLKEFDKNKTFENINKYKKSYLI